MKYALLIYTDPTLAPTPNSPEAGEQMAQYYAFTTEVAQSGQMKAGEALMAPADATTVRIRDGKTTTTDGPFAETREYLGGFYTVDCESIDQAIEWAAKIPGVKTGSIEVRPVWEVM